MDLSFLEDEEDEQEVIEVGERDSDREENVDGAGRTNSTIDVLFPVGIALADFDHLLLVLLLLQKAQVHR